ncbi:hypothetical protein RFJ04_001317 [Klebsiella variicola]|nr:hypothetical protein [Klebsiella variicola]
MTKKIEGLFGGTHLLVLVWDARGNARFTCPTCGSSHDWMFPWPFGVCVDCDVYFSADNHEWRRALPMDNNWRTHAGRKGKLSYIYARTEDPVRREARRHPNADDVF